MLPLQEAPSPPTSGPKQVGSDGSVVWRADSVCQCGIGCNINTNEYGELFVTKV